MFPSIFLFNRTNPAAYDMTIMTKDNKKFLGTIRNKQDLQLIQYASDGMKAVRKWC